MRDRTKYGKNIGVGTDNIDNPARRKLPMANCPAEEEYLLWLRWKMCPPEYPGWYWVSGQGVWPMVVEFREIANGIQAVDRLGHIIDHSHWSRVAGPIPDPPAPTFVRGEKELKKFRQEYAA